MDIFASTRKVDKLHRLVGFPELVRVGNAFTRAFCSACTYLAITTRIEKDGFNNIAGMLDWAKGEV